MGILNIFKGKSAEKASSAPADSKWDNMQQQVPFRGNHNAASSAPEAPDYSSRINKHVQKIAFAIKSNDNMSIFKPAPNLSPSETAATIEFAVDQIAEGKITTNMLAALWVGLLPEKPLPTSLHKLIILKSS